MDHFINSMESTALEPFLNELFIFRPKIDFHTSITTANDLPPT
jgi:hypothetical protein